MKRAFTGAEGRGTRKGHHCARVQEARHGLAVGPPPRCPMSGAGGGGEGGEGKKAREREKWRGGWTGEREEGGESGKHWPPSKPRKTGQNVHSH